MNEDMKSAGMRIARRACDILLHPVQVWSVISQEPGGLTEVFVPYAVVMSLIPTVTMLTAGAGMGLFAARMAGQSGARSIVPMMGAAAVAYVGGLLITLLVGKAMEWMSPLFGARRSWVLSCRVLVYAPTPFFTAGLLGFIPILGGLFMLLCVPWALVLLYLGIGHVLEVKGVRQLLFTLATLASYSVVGMLTMATLAILTHRNLPKSAPMAIHSHVGNEAELADKRFTSGQATDADIEKMIDQQIPAYVLAGVIKPGDVAQSRAQLIKNMQALQAAIAKMPKENLKSDNDSPK